MNYDLFSQPLPEPKPRAYFNTVPEPATKVIEYTEKAEKENERVLIYLKQHGIASPSQVHRAVGGQAPLTNIRRALTTLTKAGKLRKTEHRTMGPFGRNEGLWEYIEQP